MSVGSARASQSQDVQDAFRLAMGAVCTPVAVITSFDGDRPHGTTVSAFASLSMTPPMVLVSLDRGSDLLAVVTAQRRFGVNILASHQHELAMNFARKGDDKFTGIDWTTAHELPQLTGSSGWVACHVAEFIEGGDHIIALGNVIAASSQETTPLTYHQRVFGTHSALDPNRNGAAAS